MIRLNKKILFIGRTGTGKTTIAYELAKVTGKKIVVVDDSFHPFYQEQGFKQVTLSYLDTWESGNIVVIGDPTETLIYLNKHCSNAVVICEDAAKYIDASVKRDLKAFIIDHRKRNFDCFIMFHFLAEVPPFLCRHYDSMVLFKTGDNLEEKLKKFANWHIILERGLKVNAHPSYNYKLTIRKDE